MKHCTYCTRSAVTRVPELLCTECAVVYFNALVAYGADTERLRIPYEPRYVPDMIIDPRRIDIEVQKALVNHLQKMENAHRVLRRGSKSGWFKPYDVVEPQKLPVVLRTKTS